MIAVASVPTLTPKIIWICECVSVCVCVCVCEHDLVCACFAMLCKTMFCLLLYVALICMIMGICVLYVFLLSCKAFGVSKSAQ